LGTKKFLNRAQNPQFLPQFLKIEDFGGMDVEKRQSQNGPYWIPLQGFIRGVNAVALPKEGKINIF
jgi:hypothetical protein